MENCIFSKIARGESDTQIIYEVIFICIFINEFIYLINK